MKLIGGVSRGSASLKICLEIITAIEKETNKIAATARYFGLDNF